MMIPIPRPDGSATSRVSTKRSRSPASSASSITAKPDQLLVPLPEGSSYLGFIFARGRGRGAEAAVVAALRAIRARRFRV